MPDTRPLMFPNVENVVSGYLRGRPELVGVPVGSLPPPGFDGTQRAVVLTRLGGHFADDDLLDHAEVRIDSYGPDKPAAHALACVVRGVLPLITSVALADDVVLPDTTEIQGPCFSLDRRFTDAGRYLMKYRFLLVIRPRPA
ncbi:hypothetical protein ACFQ05_03045 [Amycolatopsis umgeniensis]|uniref:DUF3168 domain-containing protein n=1 Tax=Amycolatopsis umgeniensis TaxID=336628 RepID=A0A841B1N6_9PSEU|nr:hypothetical protein [Amycolatopsis umgeniensis]MBB5852238.1 hypothetical protein [Amycolatopsis umgeniensis]